MMTRYDPFQDLFRIRAQAFGPRAAAPSQAEYLPAVDVYEDESGLVFEAELPGVRLEDVELEIEKDVLTLRGERKLERDAGGEGTWRIERRAGRFERAFRLPDAINVDSAEAEMKDGVLSIRFQKKAEVKPRKIDIKLRERDQQKKAA